MKWNWRKHNLIGIVMFSIVLIGMMVTASMPNETLIKQYFLCLVMVAGISIIFQMKNPGWPGFYEE